jgi:hypothetical protein
MNHEFGSLGNKLAVDRMLYTTFYSHSNGLIHLVAYDFTNSLFAKISLDRSHFLFC